MKDKLFFDEFTLDAVFKELCRGNLSVLTTEVYQAIGYLSADIIERFKIVGMPGDGDLENIKLLVMIGNIVYNRTDIFNNPIEDSVYDYLMEIYKKYDPNFQVGSVVVDFQAQAEDLIKKGELEKPIEVFEFYEPPQRDEVREYYAKQLGSFDKGKLTHQEVFGEKSPIQDNGPVTKRSHNTVHNHPSLVGTLDKAKYVLDSDAIEKDVYDEPNTTILERDFFRDHINRGIITEDQEIEMVLELKYDGISVEADCTDIVLSARTRGDTGIGQAADITPFLYGYNFMRNNGPLKDRTVGVKFEAIMSYSDLQNFCVARGKNYVNARSAIVGLFSASDSYLFRDYITLVPLALDREDVPEVKNRMEEIELLNSVYSSKGEPLRYCYIKGDYKTCLFLIKKFVEEAKYARNYLNFMFDGIVVSYLDEGIRAKLGRENYINKYSIAVKFDPLSRYTTFLGYTFNVGQSGNICPMIHYTPVEFLGTIHPKSSGASRRRFMDLALKVGDIIEVTYNNDVMPYVTKVDCEHNLQNQNPLIEFPEVCPCCGTTLEISKSGDSARCPNWYCHDRIIARLTATLNKLGIDGFAEASVEKLGIINLTQLMSLSDELIAYRLGSEVEGKKLSEALANLKKKPMYDYQLIGALGFTGIGAETWKKIFARMDMDEFADAMVNDGDIIKYITDIKGIGSSTIDIISNEGSLFKDDICLIAGEFNWIDSMDLQYSAKIRFTGCRNAELEQKLQAMGYDASGAASVTKDTDILIVPYEGFSSTKTDKVSELCQVVPINEFMENMDKYLM